MKIDQADTDVGLSLNWQVVRVADRRMLVFRAARMLLALLLLGSGGLPAATTQRQAVALAVAGSIYDLVNYEVHAVGAKARALVEHPASAFDPEEASELVIEYMARAAEIGSGERELARRASGADPSVPGDDESSLTDHLADLRAGQDAVRPAVEQVIQRQVMAVLVDLGFGASGAVWPPVQFSFVEPPKKLIVSRRDRIETIHSHMLAPTMSLSRIEEAEAEIDTFSNMRAYITEIGGLGAYPAMVVDQASLEWVLSTVAHEWVHNYLVFFPLGWSYFTGQQLTTMNETVAEIVGNEVGRIVLERYYPKRVSPSSSVQDEPEPEAPPEFDFRAEMRATRLEVDRLLANGRVEEAENYMEKQRGLFVDHGYPIRVLNQAYFAFHGSYGTSAASTDPIGPQLRALRAAKPDVVAFLQTVRWYTTVDDLIRDVGSDGRLEIPQTP